MKTPKIPDPSPMPTASVAAPGAQRASPSASQSAALRGFSFVPTLSGFKTRTEGRKSLIGG